MNDKEYAKSMCFVVDVLSTGIEALPRYEIRPPEMEISPKMRIPEETTEKESRRAQVVSIKGGFFGGKFQQFVKRTCGRANKGVRMDHK